MFSLVLRDGTSVSNLMEAIRTPEDLNEFTHFRHEISLAHRPLEPIAPYPDEREPVSIASLRKWIDSPEYRAAQEMFASYPDRSLCRAIDRMLLYHLVRVLRPENVVEIGTYFAAGSEVLARALWENGAGLLHTTDPFGPIRGPALIGRWDERLQAHTRFYPWSSMELFHGLAENGTTIDLAFIDGNHDFEYALFDLQSSARILRPGGVVVMDDANQSGPFWAAKVFLEQNPGWIELGESILRSDAAPLETFPALFPESKFLLLQAPREVVVGRLPFTTGAVGYGSGKLAGMSFDFLPDQHGELLGRVFLRAFPAGEVPQQLMSTFRLELAGESRRDVQLAEVMQTRHADAPAVPRHTLEIVLLWRPREANVPLRLAAPPRGFAPQVPVTAPILRAA